MNREAYMKLIEEISLNAWPSHKIELYDGWLIRFSHNYTHRTNSVQQVGASSIPVEEKVAYCEAMYANYHTPAIFKISPLLDPAFDRMLEERGYEIQHTTEVMTMDLKKLNAGCRLRFITLTRQSCSSGTGSPRNGSTLCSV